MVLPNCGHSFYGYGSIGWMPFRKHLKQLFKRCLTSRQVDHLLRFQKNSAAWLHNNDLIRLAEIFGTDKWGSHWYAQHYQHYFQHLRTKPLKILEIGIGGVDRPNEGGSSLRMWRAFFPNSMICGIDLYDKKPHEEKRIRTFRGDQADPAFLKKVVDEMGGVDIVIDDGSHINAHVIQSFQVLFPLLSANGIYIVEDTQTSYWPEFGGNSEPLQGQATIMGYFKSLTDGLNYEEFAQHGFSPSYFDQHIVGVHFYHNMIFIFKGLNNEASR